MLRRLMSVDDDGNDSDDVEWNTICVNASSHNRFHQRNAQLQEVNGIVQSEEEGHGSVCTSDYTVINMIEYV